MSSPIEIVSPDRWFADGISGDVLLCDPFTGQPLIAGGLNKPPEVFAEDDDLGGGYSTWKVANILAPQIPPWELGPGENPNPPVSVGVLLTEPSARNGAGTLEDLRTNMGNFSVVGYANKRSLIREAKIKGVAPTVGAVTASGEILPDDGYMDMVMGVAAEQDKITFSFDPEKDFFDGKPVGRTASGLYKVENAVRTEMIGQDDPSDTQAHVGAMDAVYSNTLQWHGVGVAGNKVSEVMSDVGVFPDSVLLIVPAEHHHLVRKVQMAGGRTAVASQAVFARPEFENIPEARAYPIYSEGGFIPGGAIN